MISGRQLHCETFSPATEESVLLLNPRWPPAWRQRVLDARFPELPRHVWVGTSGTSGRLRLVALSRTAMEESARAVNRHLDVSAADIWIDPLPLFHVGGIGIAVRARLAGAVCLFAPEWNAREFVHRTDEGRATLTALVPAQVHDLVAAECAAPPRLRAVVVGGGALEAGLQAKATALGWPLLPSYGLTEAASQVATARAAAARGAWLPLLDHCEARTSEDGVLELRAPSLLTGWMVFDEEGRARWDDPKREGWYRTGDRAEVRGRQMRVLGRVDELVKIRGELVDFAALERALQARVAPGLVMVRALPDGRNGAVLHIVAEDDATAAGARRCAGEVFPAFARPESISVGPIRRTALGKTLRG